MPGEIKRPSYTAYEVSDVAEAANLIAAEAQAAGCSVLRPFDGSTLEGRPTWTAAHSVAWWHIDQERARDRAHDAERDALRARAEAAEQRAEAAERELAQARAVVESRLAEVSQYDYTMRTLWGSHSKDREVEIRTLQKVLHDINALRGAA
jgi:hypothetical protein